MQSIRMAFVSAGDFTHICPYLTYYRDQGHDVHWIAYTRPFDIPGITIHDISCGVGSKDARWTKWRYFLCVPRLREVLKTVKPDIMHGHYSTSAGVLCLLSGFRPYMLSVRGTDLVGSMRSRIWRYVLSKAFSRAAMVHAVSDQLAGLVLDLGVPAERCLVLTQGVDLDRLVYREPRAVTGPLRILCTRGLWEVYDPFVIVRACALLKEKGLDFTLTFAGTGPLLDELRNSVSAAGLDNHIIFLNGYSNSRVSELLAQTDLYVSASRWDGTSISLLEAMACGVFPVVTRIPSNEAWIGDGTSALTFAPGNERELADAIVRAGGDERLRLSAVQYNRSTVEMRANRVRNMQLLEQQYVSVIEQSGSTPMVPPSRVSQKASRESSRSGSAPIHWDDA